MVARKLAPTDTERRREAQYVALCVRSRYAGLVRKRYFTLAQANALLPQVRARLSRMMQLSAHLRSGGDGGTTPTPPGTPWLADPVLAAWDAPDPEVARAVTASLYETLSHELRGLESLGVEVKDLTIGLVDFPSLLDGASEVFLCWKIDERAVGYYHPVQAGFRQRKPIEGHTFLAAPAAPGQLRD
jgi:hypothetical protein